VQIACKTNIDFHAKNAMNFNHFPPEKNFLLCEPLFTRLAEHQKRLELNFILLG